MNGFTKQAATKEQQHDLLNFRGIGLEEFLLRVSCFTLRQPSVRAPNRRKKLLTMTERKSTSSKLSQLERDRRLLLTFIKKKIQHSLNTGTPIQQPGEQLMELLLALCDHDGNQHKGQKSFTTTTLERRNKDTPHPVFTTYLPANWQPQCIILEGMFLINTQPLGLHQSFGDYAKFLLQRHIKPQLARGKEVHIVLGIIANTPKFFERKRRDNQAEIMPGHNCDKITSNTKVPEGNFHKTLLNCRNCKRGLVVFLRGLLTRKCTKASQGRSSIVCCRSL